MRIINATLAGGIMVSSWAIALFFYRFWLKTHERLLGLFAAAFFLLGIERIAIVAGSGEVRVYAYVIRLSAFLLILYAIYDKNRVRGAR